MVRALKDSGFVVVRGAVLLKGGIVALSLGQRSVSHCVRMSAYETEDMQHHLAEKCSCKNGSSSSLSQIMLLNSFDGLLLLAVAITVTGNM
jgi:hypothetical protein